MILRSAIIFLTASLAFAPAQDRAPVEPASLPAPDQPVAPVKPSVEKLDETRYQVGKIIFDQKTREIRFPAKVNTSTMPLEFLLVNENGKLHESLLKTDASPTQLNLVFTLLRYPPSRELYPLPNDHGGSSNEFPKIPTEMKSAARVLIEVEWKDGGKTRRLAANELIQQTVKTTAMPAGPWVYGASEFNDGKYAPEVSGDMIAIFVTNSALINYPGEDNTGEDVWIPYPKRIPVEDTDVTVIISPFSNNKPLPKP
ncbi:MAG: YdjY domain-containing protein [Luteolibacter sp.]